MKKLISYVAAACLALALGARDAAAQDGAARLSQLEAENAVLKLEVRALRERIEALEEIVRARLGTAPAEPIAGAGPPAPAAARLSDDGREVIVPGLDAGGIGAKSPEELARLFVQMRRQQPGADKVMAELSAFGHLDFYVPDELWAKIKPAGFPGAPARDDLAAVLTHMERSTSSWYSREIDVRTDLAAGAAFVIDLDLGLDKSLGESFRLTGVRVNGRCFIAHIRSASIEEPARAFVAWIRDAQNVPGGAPRATSFDELRRLVPSEDKMAQGWFGMVTPIDPNTVRLPPFYRVELRGAGRGEYYVIATPSSPHYATFHLGPVPGAHDPLKNPYAEVRAVETPVPERPAAPAPGGERRMLNEKAAIATLRSLVTAQAIFRDADKEGDGSHDYARSVSELIAAKLIDPGLESLVRDGYRFVIVLGDEDDFAMTAAPIRPGVTGDRWFRVEESGVIGASKDGLVWEFPAIEGE